MDSSTVRDPVRRRLAITIERIVQRTPELSNPRYLPTFWAAGMWPNLALLMIKQVMMMIMMMIVMMIMMIKQRLDVSFRNRFRRVCLRAGDGGTVSVDWPEDAGADKLPLDAPIVIFLHTVTGSSSLTSHYTRAATRRGWRSCVFNR